MTNHGGCAILNEMITYPDRKETRKKFQKTGMPWWSNEKANLLLVPIFSAMDGTVLYSIMAYGSLDTVRMQHRDQLISTKKDTMIRTLI